MKKILVYLFLATLFVSEAYSQIRWTKDTNNPVLKRGSGGEWDNVAVGSPSVIYYDSLYHMWFNGSNGNNTNIGYATSTDKIHWEKLPVPVLEHGNAGSWESLYILHPAVYFNDTTFHTWYTGTNGSIPQIGHATSPDGVNWTKDSTNPVITPGSVGSWDDGGLNAGEVIFIGGVFHMWYAGFKANLYQIGHATSTDGITWEKDSLNPVLQVGAAGRWDNASVLQPSVLFDGITFHMWYGGGPDFAWRIGYAQSSDGRHWVKKDFNNTPSLGPGSAGSWDSKYVGYHTVRFNSDSTGFDMWYSGSATTGYTGDIGYAAGTVASFDFEKNPLIKYASNPVFPKGETGKWDEQFVSGPSILYDGNIYQMWYSGYDGGEGSQTGYAFSSDGITWNRYPNPVIQRGPSGTWDDYTIFQPCVLFDSSTSMYKMWFSGHDASGLDTRQIGYATSPDSINWVKHPYANPVLKPGLSGSWDDLFVESPEVLFIDGVYHMWYGGSNGTYIQIGHATSPDGIVWEKDTLNPVLRVGDPGSWDAGTIDGPCVLFDGEVFHMWYGGAEDDGWGWRTGYAYSYDGRNWIKDIDNNPVLRAGDPGSWDDLFAGIGGCTVMFVEDASGQRGLKMWYGGGNGIVVGDVGFAATDTADIVSVKDESLNVIPSNFSLFQNYPNPFNPTTKIRYQVPTTGLVSLRIYNVLGEIVTTLVNEEKPVGYFEVELNAANLSSGVYFYRLQAGNFVETKKMVLMK